MLFVDLGNLQQINLLRNDRDVILIVKPTNTAPRKITEDASFHNNDDEGDAFEEDEARIEK